VALNSSTTRGGNTSKNLWKTNKKSTFFNVLGCGTASFCAGYQAKIKGLHRRQCSPSGDAGKN
jgi:hypothetical protein